MDQMAPARKVVEKLLFITRVLDNEEKK